MDLASRCRRLASSARFGSLATLSRDPPGFPFATLVAVACDERGRPLLLLSRLAEHTKNLDASDRVSLLIAERSDDPLASGRMTLVGTCATAPAPDVDKVRETFLAAHPTASGYVDFSDFAFWRVEVATVRWVGGFGRMDWLRGEDYASAPPA